MEPTILRHEVLQQMDSGDPFDLVFIQADRKRGTAGRIKRVTNWLKINGDEPVERLPGQFRRQKQPLKRDPEHSTHRTVNIYNPSNPGDHAIKVHWPLMIFFNGKRILQ